MKKRWMGFELILVAGLIASGFWVFQQTDQAPSTTQATPQPELYQQFQARGFAAIQGDDLEAAQQDLEMALSLAHAFPAGDRRMAETLDDLGLLYFRKGSPEIALRYQGRAVTALLLSGGPQDPELSVYIERYIWAQNAVGATIYTEEQLLAAPYLFLINDDDPSRSPRRTDELAELVGVYEQLGDQTAVELLGEY